MNSTKSIKTVEELVRNKKFMIPGRFANDYYNGKRCVMVGIGGKSTYLPVEESTEIPYEAFCVLKDSGIFGKGMVYGEGEEFDPCNP